MKTIFNVRISIDNMLLKIRQLESNKKQFVIKKNNGSLVFIPNGKAFFPGGTGRSYNVNRKANTCTMFTVKVLDKNNNLKMLYSLNLKADQTITLSDLNKTGSDAMKEYIIKEVESNILKAIGLVSYKAKTFFDVVETCYCIDKKELAELKQN